MDPVDIKIGHVEAGEDELLDEIFDHTQLKGPEQQTLPASLDNIETKYNTNLNSRRLMKSKLG